VDAKALAFEIPRRHSELADVVLNRCISHYRSLFLSEALEGAGLSVINRHAVAEVCSNKLATSIALSNSGVPTPRTYLALSAESAEAAAEALGYPLVLKPFTGSWGRMVTIVRDRETLLALAEFKEELANPAEHMYYLQEFIKRPHGTSEQSWRGRKSSPQSTGTPLRESGGRTSPGEGRPRPSNLTTH